MNMTAGLIILSLLLAVPPGFDHQKTRFPLQGQHLQMARSGRCASCHPGDPPLLRGTPTACADAACHLCDDVHRGAAGPRCADCHQAVAFEQPVASSHAASPERLGGAHDRVPCTTCHGDGRRFRGPGRPWRALRGMANLCVACHQRDDIHHNGLGPRCGDCHTQQSFAGARFHHEMVGCALRGVHRVLPCVDCHRAGDYVGLSPLCISCHRDDAMRAAAAGISPELHVQQTACTHCHNTITFRLGASTRQSPPESVCQ